MTKYIIGYIDEQEGERSVGSCRAHLEQGTTNLRRPQSGCQKGGPKARSERQGNHDSYD